MKRKCRGNNFKGRGTKRNELEQSENIVQSGDLMA